MELVDFSRDISKESFTICVKYLYVVTIEEIKTIGRDKGYYERSISECKLR